jgi:hypothetical protein
MKKLISMYFLEEEKLHIHAFAEAKNVEEMKKRIGLLSEMIFLTNNFVAHAFYLKIGSEELPTDLEIIQRLDHQYI